VGKTRLAEELVVHARGEGAFVLEGRCVPYGEVNVWAPLAEALRRAAGVGPEDPPEQIKAHGRRAVAAILGLPEDDPEVNRILDAITLLMGGHQGSPRGAAPSRSRPGQTEVGGVGDEALQPVALCLEKLCTHRPLVFVIGELHWADDLFLAFLDRLLQRIVELPVLFVATARPEVLGRWQPPTGRHNRAILHVDPLDAAASSALLAHLAPEGLSEEDSKGLVERSGGNPLWLEELAALAGGTAGGIRQAGGAGQPGRDGQPGRPVRIGEGAPLPATLRGIVAARLDLLGPETTEVLEDAAVCGRTGTVAALRAMGEAAGRPTTESCLDALVAAGLLSLTHGRESWELRSELVREVAYGTLTKAERARRHTRLAEWLAARAGDDPGDDVLDDLAHHWTAAAEIALEVGAVPGLASVEDVVGRALGWVRQAASRAVAHELWPPATALLDTAVRLVDDPASPDITGSDRAEIHLDRARTRVAMHDAVGARSDLEIVGRFDAAGLLRASALVVAGDLARIEGRLADAEHDLTDALGQARSNEDVATELDALRALGQVRLFAGDDAGAESVAAEALVVARRSGDRRGEAWALQHLAWTAFANGDVRPARERLVRSAEVFAEIGDRGGLSWAEGLLAFVLMASGELVEAEEMGRRVLREAMRTGDTWAECMMRALVASCRLWLGAPEEAVAEAERAVQGLRGIDDVWGSLQARMVLGRARLACGDVDLGLADLESAVALDRDLDKSHATHQAHVVMTLALALQVGDGQAALDAAPDPEALPADAAEDLRAAMAIAHAQAGSVPDAVRAVAPLLGWETAARPLRPSAAPWVALVLTAAGRVPEAEAVLRATPADAPRTALDEAWAAMAATALGANAGDEAVACAQRAGDLLVQRTIRRGLAILGGETPEGEALPGWDRLWAAVRAGAAAAAGV
ncbi:MAG TPA: AAA family ATPase, partial [Acidimicrobiales bacterium]